MHWLDIVLSALLIVATLKGLLDGFVKQVISIVVIVLAVYLSLQYGPTLGRLIMQTNTEPLLISGVGGLIVFVGTLLLGTIVSKLFTGLFNATPIGIFNRLLGGVLAFCSAVLILSALAAAWDAINQGLGWGYDYEKSTIYPRLLELFRTIWNR
ncbi:CvpA family protein [Porphyromonas cangingivalis]|uniref:Membrane protein required for colicin V production n=1 Tax=Porphyromonas cangingivalis TaxID=36874 RepID=A0A1T4MA43_PORCN|nr:CvpA family protein [Porphyromonas cangingivalis]SJZ63648.1 membrane protein required for colicin V production [Porphyromonas cangingivalis]SPY34796.1 Pur regulon 18 kDa protein [Porphyromonas cangingivalis]VEJ02398.1 Pur regulon 18 kDa protein [Porphyromonas cangingivalis]